MKAQLPSDKLALAIATLGPVGNFPTAPGTWGSLAAVIAAPWLFLCFPPPGRLVVLALVFAVGIWASSRAESILVKKDPGCVVIDEVFGQWVALLCFTAMPLWQLGLGFLLFRLFDILKPWPIRRIEKTLPDGWGVMADDGVAGVYALIVLELLVHTF